MVGDFTGRDQFSMVTIHYGERNILGNREIFPYAFGILGANLINIQAFTDLIVRNSWTRVVLLYSEGATDLVELSTGIEKNIKDVPGFNVAFTSPIYSPNISGSSRNDSKTILRRSHSAMRVNINYFCTEEDISKSIYRSLNFVWSLVSDDESGHGAVGIDGYLASLEYISEYEEGYEKQQYLYINEYNVSSMPVEWARGIYDAVWSLAFALNNSLNMKLTEFLPGSKKLAQAIASHMSNVDFQGVSGGIDFDKKSGFNTARRINIYQFGVAKSNTLIGFYTSKEYTALSNEITPQFIMPTFIEKHTQVSIAVAADLHIMCYLFIADYASTSH